MSRLLNAITKLVLGLAVALIVAVAILVGIARAFVFEAETFQEDLASWITQQTGLQFQFNKLTGSWQGLAPRLQFSDLLISDNESGEPGISARHVDIEWLILSTLFNGEPRVRLTIDGAKLATRYKNGYLQLLGFNQSAPTAKENDRDVQRWIEILTMQPWLSLTDSQIEVKGLYDQDVTLALGHVQFESNEKWKYVAGDITVSGPGALSASVRGRVKGSLFQKNSLSGRLYGKLDPADLDPWIFQDNKRLAQAKIESLSGGGEFWLTMSGGKINELVSRFDLNTFQLSTENKIKPPQITQLKGELNWQGTWGGDWRLAVGDLVMRAPEFVWQPSVVNLTANQLTGNRTNYIANVDEMDITPWLNYYLGTQASDGEWHQWLTRLRPEGKLKNVYIDFALEDHAVKNYRFSLELFDFHNRPFDFIPGFHDLEFKVLGNQSRAYLALEEDYFELNYPRLFRDQLLLTKLNAGLRFALEDDGVYVQSNEIQAATEDVKGAVQFSLFIPKDKTYSPFLSLQSTLRQGNGALASKYLPAGVIDEKTLGWLDQAILEGNLLRGDILVYGPTRKQAEEPLHVLLGFTASDGVLRFDPHWKQPIEQALADVLVDDGEVIAHIKEATYFEQKLVTGSVYLPPYQPDQPHPLTIKAKTQGELAAGFNVLKDTPLLDILGDFILDIGAAAGDLGVDLTLEIPLAMQDKERIKANADIEVQQAGISWLSQNLNFSAVNGSFNYETEHGFSASAIRGKTLGGDFGAKVTTQAQAESDTIKVTGFGKAKVAALKTWKPLAVLEPASGTVNYELGLTLPLGERAKFEPVVLNLGSNLMGVVMDVPKPFTKTASSSLPFHLNMKLYDDSQLIAVRYGKELSLELDMVPTGLRKGAIRLGGGDVLLPLRNRLTVAGSLSYLNYDEWDSFLRSRSFGSGNTAKSTAANSDNESATSEWKQWLLLLDDSAFRLEQVVYRGQEWGTGDFSIYHKDRRWRVGVENKQVSGVVEIPFNLINASNLPAYGGSSVPLSIELQRLHFPGSKEPDEQSLAQQTLSPRDLPPVDVRIENLINGDTVLGSWLVKLSPLPTGMRIESINGNIGENWLTGEGVWLQPEPSASSSTQVDLAISGSDIGKAMQALMGTPLLSSEKTTGFAKLSWPGAPYDFSLDKINGSMNIDLTNGKLYEVNANAAGKVWGALNFETLLRRLQLNFDDLSESEMVYDSIESVLRLQENQLLVDSMRIEMPSINMNIDGLMDLTSSTLNMDLDVTIPITRNLVLPAAVIGGLPAAATAFVVEKLFGSQFDKLTTLKYKVSGPVREPTIQLKGAQQPNSDESSSSKVDPQP